MTITPILEQKVTTSSLRLDLPQCDFEKLQWQLRIIAYPLPGIARQRLRDWKKGYAMIHNWAKNATDHAYYLQTSGQPCLYLGLPGDQAPPLLQYEGLALTGQAWEDFENPSRCHIWLKVLLAHFLLRHRQQVANEALFLHTGDRHAKRQTVLKVSLSHHWKLRDPEQPEFFLADKATRLRKCTVAEWRERPQKGLKLGVPYALDFLEGLKTPVFRQLKTDSLDPKAPLWLEDTYRLDRSQLSHHDLSSLTRLEHSRVGLLHQLQEAFIRFAGKMGIVLEAKTLQMQQVLLKAQKRQRLPGKTPLRIRLLDLRRQPRLPLRHLSDRLQEIARAAALPFPLEISSAAEAEALPALMLMDYSAADFAPEGKYAGKADPYQETKQAAEGQPLQGLRLEDSWLSGTLEKKNLRNPAIALTQLYLKQLVAGQGSDFSGMSAADSLEGKLFLQKRGDRQGREVRLLWAYLWEGRWHAGLALGNGEAIEKLNPVLEQLTGRSLEEVQEYWAAHHEFNFRPGSDRRWNNCDLILSPDYIWEIGELPERFFYDVDTQRLIQQERESLRPVADFFAREDGAQPDLARAYNQFLTEQLRGITELRYNELESQYGKQLHGVKEAGFFQVVFGQSKAGESIYRFFREEVGLDIYGTKSSQTDNSLQLHKGVWFDPQRLQYFVGRKDARKDVQATGFPMRQIICLDGDFEPDAFFSWLNVDFVRHEEFTVRPYPFALLKVWEEMLG